MSSCRSVVWLHKQHGILLDPVANAKLAAFISGNEGIIAHMKQAGLMDMHANEETETQINCLKTVIPDLVAVRILSKCEMH